MMRFLRWGRRGPAAATKPVLPWPDGPEPLEIPLCADGTHPIAALLEDWRLPLRETRREVVERYGVVPDPFYGWNEIRLDAAKTLPGALGPWSARSDESIPPQFPVSRFSALVWLEDSAHRNLERTAAHLAPFLGPAPIGQRWNTLVATWRAGTAEIGLLAFPPEWQTGGWVNDAHEREPRLRTACRVSVATGFRLPLSDIERTWVQGFEPFRARDSREAAGRTAVGRLAPHEHELEYARDPEDLLRGRRATLGLAPRDEALIILSTQLFVVPRADVLHLEVIRLTPAKGGGGSWLRAHCRTQAEGTPSQTLSLADAADPGGMNDFGTRLARHLGCPIEIGPAYPDA